MVVGTTLLGDTPYSGRKKKSPFIQERYTALLMDRHLP